MILFIHTQHLSSHFTLPPACLSALGAGETWRHTLLFFLSLIPLCLSSLLPSNHCWLLVAIDIRRLIKPWRSCLIYAGEAWVVVRKCSKDTSHLLQYLLSYSPGSAEDPAWGSFCQMLDLAACFTFCSRLYLIINVCKCCNGGDKNKHRCGIWVPQRVRLGDLCVNDNLPPLDSVCLYIYIMYIVHKKPGYLE